MTDHTSGAFWMGMGIENKRWVDGGRADDESGGLWVAMILTAFALAIALVIPLP